MNLKDKSENFQEYARLTMRLFFGEENDEIYQELDGVWFKLSEEECEEMRKWIAHAGFITQEENK